MAHHTYKKETWKECPRCGSKEAIISVFHFGATHDAECNKCGLQGKSGTTEDTALQPLIDKYFEWEEKHKTL